MTQMLQHAAVHSGLDLKNILAEFSTTHRCGKEFSGHRCVMSVQVFEPTGGPSLSSHQVIQGEDELITPVVPSSET